MGRVFEDHAVGMILKHAPGRTITEADNVRSTSMTMNANPVHCDAHYAKQTEFGRPLVNSCVTLALVTGLSVLDIDHAYANLGWDEVRLPAPVAVGDTIYAGTHVLEARASGSKPQAGILRVQTTGFNPGWQGGDYLHARGHGLPARSSAHDSCTHPHRVTSRAARKTSR